MNKDRHHSERGRSLLDAAILIPIFLAVVFMGMEVMIMSFRVMTLQYVTTQAVRKAATGVCNGPAPIGNLVGPAAVETKTCLPGTGFAPEVYAVRYLKETAQRFGVNLNITGVNICLTNLTALNTCPSGLFTNMPAAGEIVALKATMPMSFFPSQGHNYAIYKGGIHLGGGFKASGAAIARVENF